MQLHITNPTHLHQTTLADGRQVAWAEWGAPDGTPVLLSPGAGTSRSLGFGREYLAELGIRLISIDRPGLGGSTPLPGRSLIDWAADVAELAKAEGLTSLKAVGYSQGAPFALACAAAGVVDGVAIVAGTDELAHPSLRPHLAPDVLRLVEMAAADPGAAEASFAGFGGASGLWELIIAMSSEQDQAVFTAPDFAQAFRQALADGFAQGPAGYARDTLLTMSPWPFDPGSINVPVDLWYGERDTSPVHSPDFGATLAKRIPGARHHLLPEAGSALLWTHAEPILRALLG